MKTLALFKGYTDSLLGAHTFESSIIKQLGEYYADKDDGPLVAFEKDFNVTKLLSDQKPDVVWFPTPWHVKLGATPYIFTVWDLAHRTHPWFPEVGQIKEWNGREEFYADTIRRAFKTIVSSELLADQLMFFYGVLRENIEVIGFPSPEMEFGTEDVVEIYKLKKPYVYYPASIWPHKNHAIVIKAIAELRKEGRDYQLVMTGQDFGNLAYLENMAMVYGVGDLIRFLGVVPRERVTSLYLNATAVTYMSFFGPDNIPPMETMSLGVPLIMLDSPGARAQCGDYPWYVRENDHYQLGAIIAYNKYDRTPRLIGEDDYVGKVAKIFEELKLVRECWKGYSG